MAEIDTEADAEKGPGKSGTLLPLGERPLGRETYFYWRCTDCHDDFPGRQCNGHHIVLCPWCRQDSKPWTNGRGL